MGLNKNGGRVVEVGSLGRTRSPKNWRTRGKVERPLESAELLSRSVWTVEIFTTEVLVIPLAPEN